MSNHKCCQEKLIQDLTHEHNYLNAFIDMRENDIAKLKDEINELDVLVHDQQKTIRSLLKYKHAHNTLINSMRLLNQG